ncbi:MAG TPA: hypothetical protein VKV06_13575, partial [Acidimicrobiales bacterium]|nr:hypothetical protein [Acidimicrobiales bacterium]
YSIFRDAVSSVGGSALWWAGRDYDVTRNDLAVGGRVLDLRTPASSYQGLWLDLHGRHQADNFAAALVAAESFFAAPIEDRLVREAAGSLSTPGRLEVVNRRPLVVLDGAKNLEGARAAAAALESDFGFRPGASESSAKPSGPSGGPGSSGTPDAGSGESSAGAPALIVVFGMLAGKDPTEMLRALGAEHARLIVACLPPSPRAVPTAVIVEAARSLGDAWGASQPSGPEVLETESVADAVSLALDAAGPDDIVLVAGSLYVVGAARSALVPADSSLR